MANEEQQTNVEKYEFEPIKGYPMLNWKGKRPFRSTQYFPAQLKEVYGQEDESGWINKIFWGDNLQVMSHLLKEFRGKIDLVYIDPPFASDAEYKKSIKLKGKSVTNDTSSFEEKQYTDLWNNDEYLQFIYERIILIKELLSPTGAVFVHCDWRVNSYIRMILDEVFGRNRFLNEIVWKRRGGTTSPDSRVLPRITDTILAYSKEEGFSFTPQFIKDDKDPYIKRFNRDDGDGRKYNLIPLNASQPRPTLMYEYKGYQPPRFGWSVSLERMKSLDEQGLLYFPESKEQRIYKKSFLEDWPGQPLTSLWTDIKLVNPVAKERTDYPTQKPESLIERIISMASKKGDLVFDCFLGSGTTAVAAQKLGRRFIGADINQASIKIASKRLVNLEYINFSVYTVNNYELFRNPVEAEDLLIEALEIQKLDSNVVYDGEKDGYKVKIMPVNRIATKEDLNELVANFPYKKFEERKAANPNKPVEEIMLVCMGHEPGLGATLENECGYKLKVEVVDILRDKSDLTFKYDSEAVIKVQDGKLIVEAFYPRNLLQKLSQQKDDVAEWREMVESIMIDWNYDGAVMEPIVIDIPDKNEFVAGEYEIPQGASNIKIKITDLLSESYEEVIAHG
ncbi:site-specific DNA-methyltransferase [Vibrio furnissii]|uniref:site-specific DNA-methyltransferase n=1 Tax=Vibrio furnissii TaxID=29494 RepID=UPI00117EF6A1|nr:site-specific DNA-methyltransferase [Vibrio furnissii]TRN27079.1 site-specific DNA-methyltransferase [Vibrio furnissii]